MTNSPIVFIKSFNNYPILVSNQYCIGNYESRQYVNLHDLNQKCKCINKFYIIEFVNNTYNIYENNYFEITFHEMQELLLQITNSNSSCVMSNIILIHNNGKKIKQC